MNKKNLDQALAALSDALSSQEPGSFYNDPLAFVAKLPKRSLSGDHISGGKILGFNSAGIEDKATHTQILLSDEGALIHTLKVDSVASDLNVDGNITAKTIKAEILEVKEIKADLKFEKDSNIPFNGPNKGLIWTGSGSTKQLTFQINPDRLFSSESIDVQKGKHFSVNGVKVIDDLEIGTSVVKSNLREVGRLRGLVVDGSMSVNNFLYYNAAADRLGLGTEEPNAAFAVAEDMVEVMLGTRESVKGIVGTFASHGFDIVTDNTTRISVTSDGHINLGNTKKPPVQVSVHGKLAIKVNMPDPEVDLHVSGPIKFNGKLHKYANTYPIAGAHNAGDIVWNNEPKVNSFVGWVCVQAGDPGIWSPFGKIGT
jgi:hypothetical protein